MQNAVDGEADGNAGGGNAFPPERHDTFPAHVDDGFEPGNLVWTKRSILGGRNSILGNEVLTEPGDIST